MTLQQIRDSLPERKQYTEGEAKNIAIKKLWSDGMMLDTVTGKRIHEIREYQASGFVLAMRHFGLLKPAPSVSESGKEQGQRNT